MDGYEALDMRYYRLADKDLLRELGFKLDDIGTACSLCPKDKACHDGQECYVGFDQILVPTHVAAILKMNQPGETK